MLSTLSSNVLLAKARAMFGRRLTKQNYQELLNCQTVSEIAHYLKNNTDYAKILSGINETDIHRGQLEVRLNQRLFEDSALLYRYDLTVGEHFADYLISRSEIEQITHSLMLLQAGKPEEYIFSMPAFLNRHTHIDLLSLSRIKSYDDLLNALGHTPYRKILEPFRPVPGIPLNYTGVENALYTYLYKNLFKNIRQYTKGETRVQLLNLFNSYLDIYNYIRIIRLKHFYHAGADFIKSSLLPFGTISERNLNEMLSAESKNELIAAMKKNSVGKKYLKVKHSYPDELAGQVRYLISRHNIHFSTHPPVVMLSYIFLLQTEIKDITNIIEGIRYKLPSSEIAKLLTVFNFETKG